MQLYSQKWHSSENDCDTFFMVTSFYRQRHCLMCSRVRSSARPWPSAGWERGWSLPEDRQRCCWGWRRERETKQNDRVEGQIKYDLKDSFMWKITVFTIKTNWHPSSWFQGDAKMTVLMQDEVIQIIFLEVMKCIWQKNELQNVACITLGTLLESLIFGKIHYNWPLG